MSTYRLEKLFSPRSVAVVGASPRDTSPGRAVLSNLRAAAFEGSIDLVNPRYAEIEGIKAVKTIQDLPTPPDLVVIATPPQSVPGIVKGRRTGWAAAIITAGSRSRLPCRCLRESSTLTGPGWLVPIASAWCHRVPSSTPVLRHACRPSGISL
jgi:acetyltransferase